MDLYVFMKKHNRKDLSKRYKETGYYLLSFMQHHSHITHLKYLFKYGLQIKSLKIILVRFPITILYYIRLKLLKTNLENKRFI